MQPRASWSTCRCLFIDEVVGRSASRMTQLGRIGIPPLNVSRIRYLFWATRQDDLNSQTTKAADLSGLLWRRGGLASAVPAVFRDPLDILEKQ